jgi:hypothetical protein
LSHARVSRNPSKPVEITREVPLDLCKVHPAPALAGRMHRIQREKYNEYGG